LDDLGLGVEHEQLEPSVGEQQLSHGAEVLGKAC
jgi:hypothetical protein